MNQRNPAPVVFIIGVFLCLSSLAYAQTFLIKRNITQEEAPMTTQERVD